MYRNNEIKQLTINEVIKRLQEVKSKHGNLKCVASIDDEGNAFNKVIFHPTPMNVNQAGEFIDDDEKNVNCVCIN